MTEEKDSPDVADLGSTSKMYMISPSLFAVISDDGRLVTLSRRAFNADGIETTEAFIALGRSEALKLNEILKKLNENKSVD